MTSGEIQKMADVELNARIAESVGWKWFGRSDEHESICWLLRPDWLERPGTGPVALDTERKRPAFKTEKQWAFATHKVPHYTESLDACHATENRLVEMGLAADYLLCVVDVARRASAEDNMRHPLRWYEVHATARQRAEAIYMALQKA